MAVQANPKTIRTTKSDRAPTKQALQAQIGRTRESLSDTVEEIKRTAEQGYASAKETVSELADYREEFQKEPLVWSLGALSAGFALGYTVGYSHKASKKGGKGSQFARFAERTIDELSRVGQSIVMPALNLNIKEIFGLNFSELLQDMGREKKVGRKSRGSGRRVSKPKRRQSVARKRATGRLQSK